MAGAAANIALGPWSQPREGGGGGTTFMDPFRMVQEGMEIRNTQQQFMAKQRAGAIMSQYADNPEGAAAALQSDPMVAGYDPEAINLQRQMGLTAAQRGEVLARTTGIMGEAGRNAYSDVIGGSAAILSSDPNAVDPTQLVPNIMRGLSKYDPALQAKLMPSLQIYLESMNHGLNLNPQSPNYARDKEIFRNRVISQLYAAGHANEVYAALGVPAPSIMPVQRGMRTSTEAVGGAPIGTTAAPPATAPTPAVTPPPPPPPTTAPTQTAGPGGGATPVQVSNQDITQQQLPPPTTTTTPPTTAPAAAPAAPSRQIAVSATEAQKKSWSDLNETRNTIAADVQQGNSVMQSVNKADELLQKFDASSLSDRRAAIAGLAQAVGFDAAEVQRIAGGDLASMQEYTKVLASLATQRLAGSVPPGGRLNLPETQNWLAANPDITRQKRAVEDIFATLRKSQINNMIQQRALSNYMAANPDDPDAGYKWGQQWQSMQQRKGLADPHYFLPGSTTHWIPESVVMDLMANPSAENRRKIDAKYGAGMSARFLEDQ